MDKINVLVTGCGGDIGQSIGKILSELELVGEFFGLDISDKNAGQFIYPNFSVGERCDSPQFLQFIEGFVTDNRIDLIIPASEPEIRYFSKLDFPLIIGKAIVVVASKEALVVGFDKLKTAQFLEKNKLSFPKTEILSETTKVESFPVIVKSRKGAGSKDVFKVDNAIEFSFIDAKQEGNIIQEYIEEISGEFTCGLFRSSTELIRTIILERELLGGFSGYGEVVKNDKIESLLNSIAEHLDLVGSINVQLRLKAGEPMVFEINPRFSSTVRFRDLLGFKDLVWTIQDVLGINIDDYEENNAGKKFYKGFSEFIK
jgi:carbamoyl-phosphate synthase large subunit